ncbi:sensor histidine kinase [Cecembia calidifontis]|jgi:hypothetical protein|uniref:Histidine kinase n=1 Tax=Cecembia calidifontis TaxID=1187080 RepID=A0A4Q7PAP7_9BACT|nr:sensor histidine kinase [Cecembia calidifontis]RZS95842.1 histidine kinase [Cecembia calidifontis]
MSKSFFSKATISNTLKRFLLVNLGVAFLFVFVQCPDCLFSREGLLEFIPNFVFAFLLSSSLSVGGFKVESYFDQKISWIENPAKRLLLTSASYLLYAYLVSFILINSYVLLTVDGVTVQNLGLARMAVNGLTPTLLAVLIVAVFITRSWLYEWKNAALEAENLKTENISSQYQSLKDQLNPHFLFNSLNTLSGLVHESPIKSDDFIQQLSKIYRYVLEVQHEELVPLQDELDFAQNYLSLQKIRFENSLEYTIAIDSSKDFFLPPLSLQLLLENAIKHNIISQEKPLEIIIAQEDENLWVKNRFQPKTSKETTSGGVGLNNIIQRYRLLSKQSPEVIQNEQEFKVRLPLLQVNQK